MKTCWIVQDYRKPVHVFESEEDARAYAAMAETKDFYEAVYVEEDGIQRLGRTMAVIEKQSGLSLAEIVDEMRSMDMPPCLRELAGGADE